MAKQHTSAPLTREAIARKALELADQIGLENVSARKLAAEFDKTAMALYRHYDSFEEIKAAVVALAYEEADSTPIPGELWDDTIRRTTASIRELNLRHARANLTTVDSAGDNPAFEAHTKRIYALHEAQGIPPEVLRKLWRLLDAFLAGFIANELRELGSAHKTKAISAEKWRSTVAGAYSDESFADGVNIILAGIREMEAPDPCDWRTPK